MTLLMAFYLAGFYWLLCAAVICLCKKILP